jgi:hypothetical protein
MLDLDALPLEEWEQLDDETEGEDLGNFTVGVQAMERVAEAIGAKKALPTLFEIIAQFMRNADDWKCRHAGLMAVAQVA